MNTYTCSGDKSRTLNLQTKWIAGILIIDRDANRFFSRTDFSIIGFQPPRLNLLRSHLPVLINAPLPEHARNPLNVEKLVVIEIDGTEEGDIHLP